MLSNKTYFLEQVNKHKLEKKAVKKELNITIDKYKLMESNYKQVQEENIFLKQQVAPEHLEVKRTSHSKDSDNKFKSMIVKKGSPDLQPPKLVNTGSIKV